MNETDEGAGRPGLPLFAVGLIFALAVLLAVSFGAASVSLADVWQAAQAGDWQAPAVKIFLHVRLPRVIGAVLCGSALSVSGVMLQSLLGNPLASPNTIGVNGGAGLAVLLVSALLPGWIGLVPVAAFLGALLTALLILALASRNQMSPVSLVLTGFAISSMLSGGMSAIMIVYPDAYVGAGNFLAGGLSALTLEDTLRPAVYIGLGLLLAFFAGRHLDILSLGADTASSLGMNVKRSRLLLVGVAALLAGAAVSFAGLVGFVGLLVPHAVRILVGSEHRWLIPLCAVGGGAFVVLCDLAARLLFAPYELPVGILLSFIGGPFFIFLLFSNRGKQYD